MWSPIINFESMNTSNLNKTISSITNTLKYLEQVS